MQNVHLKCGYKYSYLLTYLVEYYYTLHTFNGPFSGTTRVSRDQKGKTNLDLLKQETVSGSGISWAICKSAPRSRPRRLYILCWRQYSRRKLSPTLATPTTLVLTTLVAQCELSRR